MTENHSVPLFDWRAVHQDALTQEILRSERWRVTSVAVLFGVALCVYTVLIFAPGWIDGEQQRRLFAQWPWMVALNLTVISYEWGLRAIFARWIARRRRPPLVFRYVNALLELSIPTALLVNSTFIMGPRDALSSPAFLLYFFFIFLSVLQLEIGLSVFTGLVAALEHFVFAYVVSGMFEPEPEMAFWRLPVFHLNRSLALLAAGVLAGLLARQIKRQIEMSLRSVLERDQAVRIFGQYVSPQIAEKLLHQPVELAGELRHVCVMFLDIRDFSSYAAQARPEEVMAYLNRLFDFMIDTVNGQQGIVNKFLGDGFMAVFGAPVADDDQCTHAVDAAMEIIRQLEKLNAAGAIRPTRIGIGLHMGEAVAGNVGSSARKEYAIIGDVVNLASRIETATKDFGAQLLISESVRQTLDGRQGSVKDLGLVELKGQPNPVRLYQVA
jgi:adenylate cyclase